MPVILLTGFEPFDGFSVNPSEEIAKAFDGRKINQFSVVSLVLPLDYKNALRTLDEALVKHKPEYVLCCGQANRSAITIERIALNAISTKRADNYGNNPQSDLIEVEGPAAYFANIKPHELVKALVDNGIPAEISYHAGLYGCNWLLYNLMHRIESGRLAAKATFIHLPPLPSQAIEKDIMSIATMPPDMQVQALEIIIENLTD